MTDPSSPSWVRVLGGTLLAVLTVLGLEGAALLAPPAVGLGLTLAALAAGAWWLGRPAAAGLRRDLGLAGPPPVATSLLPGVALVALFVLSTLLLLREATRTLDVPMLNEILGDRSLVNRLRLLGVIVVLGPLGEELALRGWLLGHLQRRAGPLVAVVGSAIVFGVLHGVDVRIAYFVGLGIMFGAAVLAFRSLWASIALHMAVNAMGALPLLAGAPDAPAGPPGGAPSPWLGALGVTAVALLYPRWLRGVRSPAPE